MISWSIFQKAELYFGICISSVWRFYERKK